MTTSLPPAFFAAITMLGQTIKCSRTRTYLPSFLGKCSISHEKQGVSGYYRQMQTMKNPWLLSALFITLGIFISRLFVSQGLCGDTSMYLVSGKLILSGASPYVDFFDLNPPLIMYLNVIPAALAALSGLSLAKSGITVITLLALLNTFALYAVLKKGCLATGSAPERLLAPVLLAYSAFPGLLGIDFGQREHIIVLLLIPFIWLRFFAYQSRLDQPPFTLHPLLRVAIGLGFGLALSLKPFVFIFPLVIELYLQLQLQQHQKLPIRARLAKLLSAENLSALVLPIAYAIYMRLFLAEPARSNFYDFIVPLVLKDYCSLNSLGKPLVMLFWLPFLLLFLLVLSALFFFAARKKENEKEYAPSRQIAYFLALMMGCGLAYIELQTLFWPYHAIPLMTFMLTAFCFLMPGKQNPVLKLAPLLLLLTLTTGWWLSVQSHINRNWQAVFEKSASPTDRVLLLHSGNMPFYEYAVEKNLLPGSRYLWCFPVGMLEYEKMRARTPEERQLAENKILKVVGEIKEDMARLEPRFIFLFRLTPITEESRMYEYYSEHGLKDQLAKYKLVFEEGNFAIFERKSAN